MRRILLSLTVVLFTVIMFHGCDAIQLLNDPNALWEFDSYEVDIDGNHYLAIKLGNQVWMTGNLNVTHYKNGDPILEVNEDTQYVLNWGAFRNVGVGYGCLYNYWAIEDPRGMIPDGWHVPTHEEWLELVEYLGGFKYAGGKMKQEGILSGTPAGIG